MLPRLQQRCAVECARRSLAKPHGRNLVTRRPGLIRALIAPLVAVGLSSCTLGPDYITPGAPVSRTYKELKGWKIAGARSMDRGAWWSVYKDSTLNSLISQVVVSNQNLAIAEASFRQSLALVQQARAGLFPTIGATYSAFRSHEGKAASGTGASVTKTTVTLESTATWDLDVWGKIRRTIESSTSNAQASAADVENAKLSAQSQLAIAYFNLRSADSLRLLLQRTISDYRRSLTITENQYNQGTVARSDVITAQTQVKTVEAQLINVGVQRALFEHAIAVLMGLTPRELTIKPGKLATTIPIVPPDTPLSLLERRPDIIAAERLIQGQSALIGVAVVAYFPDITLSGFIGWMGSRAFPISVANEIWSIGGTAVETIFDGGLRRAQVVAAEATYYQAVATYRQTVLTAFQQVEDQLSTLRILEQQQRVQSEAVKLSKQAVDIALNEYRAGTVSYTTVVQAQAIQLSNEEADLTVRQNRMLASVSLIQALGGGWDVSQLPDFEEIRHRRSCAGMRDAIRGNIDPALPACL